MTIFVEAWRTTAELAPWLLLGAVVAGLMHALLPRGLLSRRLSGRGGVLQASVLGVPLPLCSCAVIPVGLGLKRQGASDGASVAFLISTPQTGVDSILVTASLLGWPLALFKVALALVTGVVGGWATDAVTPQRMMLPVIETGPSPTPVAWWRDALTHADELIRSVWRWLVLGVLISAALSAYAPPDAFSGLATYGPLAAMGAALGVSLPLYVCATASVPIAAALVHGGLPLGAVLVFLMAGPATNVATIGAVYRGLGRRPLVVYLATIVAGSVLGGLLFETWYGDSALLAGPVATHASHDHQAVPWWAAASAAVLIALMARYAWAEGRRWLAPSAGKETQHEGHEGH